MKTQNQESESETLYYSKNGLKASGWTDAMIREFLADVEIKYALTCGAYTNTPNGYVQELNRYHYRYPVTKVEAIEKTKAFKERKARKRAKS